MFNMFWPIYTQLEKEFKEISYYITIDKKQLKTYSIKISDLILRVVSECENISSELCKLEKIKFKDKKGHIKTSIYFNEYIDKLNEIFKLENKLINPIYENIAKDAFICKLEPFKKTYKKVNGKDKKILPWYYSYNKIKHDRIRNFKEANLENLINGLAALFLLNIYYLDKVFYSESSYELDPIIKSIEGFSDVFKIDYTFKTDDIESDSQLNSFFDPKSFCDIANPMSTYIIEFDKIYKTDVDCGRDFIDKLESSIYFRQKDGSFIKKYQNYKLSDYNTKCAIVASLNR